jgi:thioredoxin-like negative regulator of GroEL
MKLVALLLALQGMPWKHTDNLDAALAEGKSSGKAVVACFWSPLSVDCKRMDEVYGNADVAKLLADRFVGVRINVDEKADLAAKWRVAKVPAAVFIDSGGVRLTELRGWHPVKVVERTLARLADAAPAILQARQKSLELLAAGQPADAETAKLLAHYIEIDAAGPAAIQMSILKDGGKEIKDPATLADMNLVQSWGAKTSAEAVALLDKALASDPEDKSGHLAIVVRARAGRLMTAKDGKGLLATVEDAMKRFPKHDEIDWFWTAKVRAFQILEDWKKAVETADAALGAIGDSPWRRAVENMKRDCQAQLVPSAVAWKHVDDVDTAVAEAKRSNRLVLAWFVGDHADCSRMAVETISDPAVGALLAGRFVAVRVAAPDLLTKYKVDPGTALAIGSNGREYARLAGYYPPRVWAQKLTRIADSLGQIMKLFDEMDAAERKADAAALEAARVKLAHVWVEIGRLASARDLAAKIAPGSTPGAVVAVQLVTGLVSAAAQRDFDAAVAAFDKGIAADPGDASGRVESLLLEKAQALSVKKDYQAQLAAVEDGLKRYPKSDQADYWWLLKARALMNLRDPKAAAAAAAAGLAALPPDAPWRTTLESLKTEMEARK